MVYLPNFTYTFTIKKSILYVGKYTVHPMDGIWVTLGYINKVLAVYPSHRDPTVHTMMFVPVFINKVKKNPLTFYSLVGWGRCILFILNQSLSRIVTNEFWTWNLKLCLQGWGNFPQEWVNKNMWFLCVCLFLLRGSWGYWTSWWFQPRWKICSSNWIISPGIGVKMQNLWVATTQWNISHFLTSPPLNSPKKTSSHLVTGPTSSLPDWTQR